MLPEALPRANEVRLDAHLLLFTFTVSAIAAVLFGLTPVLRISAATVYKSLKERQRWASSSHHRIHRTFVAAEIALTVVLLIAAGLTIRSLGNLWSVKTRLLSAKRRSIYCGATGSYKGNTGSSSGLLESTHGGNRQHCWRNGGITILLPMSGDNEVGFWIEGQARPFASDIDHSGFAEPSTTESG